MTNSPRKDVLLTEAKDLTKVKHEHSTLPLVITFSAGTAVGESRWGRGWRRYNPFNQAYLQTLRSAFYIEYQCCSSAPLAPISLSPPSLPPPIPLARISKATFSCIFYCYTSIMPKSCIRRFCSYLQTLPETTLYHAMPLRPTCDINSNLTMRTTSKGNSNAYCEKVHFFIKFDTIAILRNRPKTTLPLDPTTCLFEYVRLPNDLWQHL